MPTKTNQITENKHDGIEYIDSSKLFETIGFSPEESIVLQFKADLYANILASVRSMKKTQHELSKILDVPQPRVSELLSGKIDKMSIEKLIKYLEILNPNVQLSIYNDRRKTGS